LKTDGNDYDYKEGGRVINATVGFLTFLKMNQLTLILNNMDQNRGDGMAAT
jgi:hypothetical protein